MPQVINTNIASLNAQRNLNASQGDANVALQRLSSGLRINSAKDDAAGLAISERFQSQISGLNMAQRNANDGISLAQTAEGAMDEITNNLQRIRELSVQSANATNSISDRQALNQEVQQRIEEINRIASQTSFNGLKVLDGTFSTQTFQVGANTGETIAISGLDSRGSQIGALVSQTSNLSGSAVEDGAAGELSVNISNLDFTTDAGVAANISLNGTDLGLGTPTTYTDANDFVTAVNSAITLDDVKAALSEDGRSLVFSNTSDAEVTADIAINDSTGTQVTATGNGGSLAKATQSNATDTLVDLTGADYSGTPSVSFSVNGETITASGTNETELITNLNNALGSATADLSDLSIQVTGSNLELVNSSTTEFTIDSITAGTGTPATGPVTSQTTDTDALVDLTGADYLGTPSVSFSVNGETITASGTSEAELITNLNDALGSASADLSDLSIRVTENNLELVNSSTTEFTIDSITAGTGTPVTGPVTSQIANTPSSSGLIDVGSSADLTLGASGSFEVNGTEIAFNVGADATNNLTTVVDEINAQLTGAGLTDLTAVVNGTAIDLQNINDQTPYAISAATISDGGIPNNSVTSTDPIGAVETITLADKFASGEIYDVNVDINGEAYTFTGMTSLNDIVSQINAESNETGIQANLNAQNDEMIFSSQFGEPFDISIAADLDADGTFDPASEVLQTVTANVADNAQSVNKIDISTREGADLAMITVDYAIDTINSFRAQLGAVQNRFESTIANLSTTSENLSASNSRIRDADFAAETAELARTQVLQSAGLSVLAQANARPQQVLQLLQG